MGYINTKKIAIIGGGPAGLTLARLLQLKGATVNVYQMDINEDVINNLVAMFAAGHGVD